MEARLQKHTRTTKIWADILHDFIRIAHNSALNKNFFITCKESAAVTTLLCGTFPHKVFFRQSQCYGN